MRRLVFEALTQGFYDLTNEYMEREMRRFPAYAPFVLDSPRLPFMRAPEYIHAMRHKRARGYHLAKWAMRRKGWTSVKGSFYGPNGAKISSHAVRDAVRLVCIGQHKLFYKKDALSPSDARLLTKYRISLKQL